MKKRTKFYALLFAMVLSLTQIIGVAVPVKAATKECSHGYTLVNGIGIRMHECGESVCITCYHGHSKRVVIPKTFKLNGKNLPPTQIDWADCGFSENGVKEIVIPDTLDYLGYWDEDEVNTSYKDITFFVHKGSKAEKAVQAEGYKYRYLNDNSNPQPVKGTSIKRTVRIQNLTKITWKKVKCDKYEIRYSQKKNMKNAKKINCGKNKTSLVIKKLKKNRKYYVQIRTKSGKKYSAWSKVKTISKR